MQEANEEEQLKDFKRYRILLKYIDINNSGGVFLPKPLTHNVNDYNQ